MGQRAYPWLLIGLVRPHFKLLRRDRPPLSRLHTMVSILLAWWVVPMTLVLFWARYLPRHDWRGTGLHIVLLVIAFFSAVIFQLLARRTLRGTHPPRMLWRRTWARLWGGALAAAISATFYFLSLGTIEGVPPLGLYPHAEGKVPPHLEPSNLRRRVPRLLARIGYSPFADLREADVSTKPPNWTGEDEQIPLVQGAQLLLANLSFAEASYAFLVRADLRGADLSGAQMRSAKLQEANLRPARLGLGSQTRVANLQGASLFYASLQGASLGAANLQGAYLEGANLQGADLRLANLQGANLSAANLQGAKLRYARGLTPSQIKDARNWELALYDDDMLEQLGLPLGHNEQVRKKLGLPDEED